MRDSADTLRTQLQRLDDEEQREQQIAGASLEAAYAYQSYARRLIERRAKLTQSVQETGEQIAEARAALADAYAEVNAM